MLIPIIISVIASLILGMVWYSQVVFGKYWMRVIHADAEATGAHKMSKRAMAQTVGIQAITSFMFVVALYVTFQAFGSFTPMLAIAQALFVWFGFVVPIEAGAALWSAKSRKMKWAMFLISAGYQLVSIVLFAGIFSAFLL